MCGKGRLVGKTTIAQAVSALLQRDGLSHTFIDVDALTCTYPRPSNDPFNSDLALDCLSSIWAKCHQRGSRNLIIARVVENQGEVEDVARATGLPSLTVCRLTAPQDTLLARIRARAAGSNIAWQEERAIQLAESLKTAGIEEVVVATEGRTPADIAQVVGSMVPWVGRPRG